MKVEEQTHYGQVLVSAIQRHIIFPKLYCDGGEVQTLKDVSLKMRVYRYQGVTQPLLIE